MSTTTTSQTRNSLHLDFPAFALVYLPRLKLCLIGGGGGPSRSGLKNGIKMVKLTGESALEPIGEMLTTGDEAVMSLSAYDDRAVIITTEISHLPFCFRIALWWRE